MKSTRFLKRIGAMFGLSVWNADDGRLFINRWNKAEDKKLWGFMVETAFRLREPQFGITFERTDEREMLLGLAFWGRVWLRFEHHRFPYAEAREWGIRWNLYEDWALMTYWNADPMEGGGYINVKDKVLGFLFGKTQYSREKIGEPFETIIPMPEAAYPAILQYERATWKRPRWPFAKVRLSTDIDIPKGVPFSGKGENSWDCGEDGVFGMGADGHSEASAVAKVVEYVYRQRKRRGDPLKYGNPVA